MEKCRYIRHYKTFNGVPTSFELLKQDGRVELIYSQDGKKKFGISFDNVEGFMQWLEDMHHLAAGMHFEEMGTPLADFVEDDEEDEFAN